MLKTSRRSLFPLLFLLVCTTSTAAAQDAPAGDDPINPMEKALSDKEAQKDEPVSDDAADEGEDASAKEADSAEEAAEDDASADSDEEEDAAPADTPEKSDKSETTEKTAYSLEKLVALALQNKALINEFHAKKAAAKWDLYRAEHITWMPSIQATTLLSVTPDNASPDAFDRNIDQYLDLDVGPFVRQDLSITVPVYTFGKTKAAAALAKLQIANTDLELENARLESVVQTQRAYWGARLSLAYQEMLEEGAELIGEQLDIMQEKRDFGEVDFDIKDLRKLQIFNAEIKSRLVDNNKLGVLARAGLHFLTDIPQPTEIQLEPLRDLNSPPKLQPSEYYIERALGHRPQLTQLDAAAEARRQQAELATSEWYPDIFAALRFGFSWSTADTAFQEICTAPSLDAASGCEFPRDQARIDGQPLFARPYGDPLNSLSLQVGVGLRWKIEPFQLYAKSKKAQAQVQVVEAQRERARKAVAFEIRTLYQKAADELEKLGINEGRLKAAERWRNQFGISNQTAGADLKDAVDPLKAYFEARAQYLQTIYDYQIARAELARAVGARGLTDDGEVVDE
ncbi:TolC family protein [Bradymonas sediminis]|uniref:Uncharacterized protein n=1 Tax=Bradymonas sediminis TaxID=1548548 RepID=A0A2Z4FKY3_9DELT|nr:TolC family protein [Bradymonas sediminis]AWV89657.1 hypothetical protein DN745_10030 [Bradymonas sediminis]TDP76603.1 outer membrane protein TolC [Bradymonas sediminis]